MIICLEGKIRQKTTQSVHLMTSGGVGYEIFVAPPLLDSIEIGKDVNLFIYTHYREYEVSLFGFEEQKQREFFVQLLSIKGIGPKMALEVISCPADILQQAFLNQDPALLTDIKGMGKKTAERVILELKNLDINLLGPSNNDQVIDVKGEVVETLEGLGYERSYIYRSLQDVPADCNETEDIIKWFLAHQGKK